MKVFNTRAYTQAQLMEALTCPVNRHMTRIEHGCNDRELFKHPDWLLDHYVKFGGAEAFAKRRSEFEKEVLTAEETIEYFI